MANLLVIGMEFNRWVEFRTHEDFASNPVTMDFAVCLLCDLSRVIFIFPVDRKKEEMIPSVPRISIYMYVCICLHMCPSEEGVRAVIFSVFYSMTPL